EAIRCEGQRRAIGVHDADVTVAEPRGERVRELNVDLGCGHPTRHALEHLCRTPRPRPHLEHLVPQLDAHERGRDDVALDGGRPEVDAAVDELRHLPYEDIGFARVDHHRGLRDAMPEVILGLGKTPDQIVAIATSLLERADRLLVTRIEPAAVEALTAAIPD